MLMRSLIVSALFGVSWQPGPVQAFPVAPSLLNASSGQAERRWLNGCVRESREVYGLNGPEGWTDDDPASTSPGLSLRTGKAVCGVHPGPLPKDQALELFDPFFSAVHGAELIKKRIAKEVVGHRPIRLSSGMMAMEQEVILHQGGMSLDLDDIHRDMGYILICETEARF